MGIALAGPTGLARVKTLPAGEGFTLITGADIDEENLLRTWKEGNQRQRRLAALTLTLRFDDPWRNCRWP